MYFCQRLAKGMAKRKVIIISFLARIGNRKKKKKTGRKRK
jgi:hypothetical protein